MKKIYLLTLSGLLLSASISAETVERSVKKSTCGDTMGYTSDVSKYTSSFYDEKGILCKEMTTIINIQTKAETVSYSFVYKFENDLLDTYFGIQFKDEGPVKDRNVIKYVYNEDGKLIKKDKSAYEYYVYDWDGDRLVSEKMMNMASVDTYYELYDKKYYNFLEGFENLPQYMECDGANATHEYYCNYTYDDNGNILNFKKQNYKDVMLAEEFYEYDESGRCVLHEKATFYEDPSTYEIVKLPTYKTEYTYEGSSCTAIVYSYTGGSWGKEPTHTIEEKKSLDVTKAPRNLTLANISTEDSPNTVQITWDADIDKTVDQSWDLYRNCELIATFTAEDDFVYVDSSITSYEHEYFVHYKENSEDTHLITRPEYIEVSTSLYPVTDIRVISSYKDIVNDPQSGSYEATFAVIGWEEPAGRFLPNEYVVYIKYGALIIEVGRTENTEIAVSFGTQESAEIIVEAVYSTGKVRAASIILTTGMRETIVNNVNVTVTDTAVYIDSEYSGAVIYAASGNSVISANGQSEINISSLNAGVYILKIETSEGISVHKFIKR